MLIVFLLFKTVSFCVFMQKHFINVQVQSRFYRQIQFKQFFSPGRCLDTTHWNRTQHNSVCGSVDFNIKNLLKKKARWYTVFWYIWFQVRWGRKTKRKTSLGTGDQDLPGPAAKGNLDLYQRVCVCVIRLFQQRSGLPGRNPAASSLSTIHRLQDVDLLGKGQNHVEQIKSIYNCNLNTYCIV